MKQKTETETEKEWNSNMIMPDVPLGFVIVRLIPLQTETKTEWKIKERRERRTRHKNVISWRGRKNSIKLINKQRKKNRNESEIA